MKKIAKIIRIITIPPVMVFLLLMILFVLKNEFYKGIGELLLSLLFLMVIPILAYPVSYLIPAIKDNRRDYQRKLAFVCSLFGYSLALGYGLIFKSSQELIFVYNTYFLSVLNLTIFNKVIKLRASGHACSIVGPLILIVYFVGWIYIIPSVILFGLVVWSSLFLTRHTIKELFYGSLCSIMAYFISLLISIL